MFLLSILVAHNSTFDDFHLQILFSFLIKKMKITLIKIKSVRAGQCPHQDYTINKIIPGNFLYNYRKFLSRT